MTYMETREFDGLGGEGKAKAGHRDQTLIIEHKWSRADCASWLCIASNYR